MVVSVLAIGLVLGLGLGCANGANIGLTVDLGYSKYQGTATNKSVSQWLGIRYAAAPVGDLRFRAPADPVTDHTLYVADTVCSMSGFGCCVIHKQ